MSVYIRERQVRSVNVIGKWSAESTQLYGCVYGAVDAKNAKCGQGNDRAAD